MTRSDKVAIGIGVGLAVGWLVASPAGQQLVRRARERLAAAVDQLGQIDLTDLDMPPLEDDQVWRGPQLAEPAPASPHDRAEPL